MIGFLRGKLIHKAPPQLVLDVQGVGYEVEAPMTTFYDLPALGEEVRLHTHLVVREDAHILFGFATENERLLFKTLIKVNGVGPKLALTILSGQSIDEFYRCVDDNDAKSLVRLPGVGQKTAERLIIEMRGRLPDIGEPASRTTQQAAARMPAGARQEAVSALCALGYKSSEAEKMVRAVAEDDKSCEDIIRQALRGAVK
ncbi:Holliday junction branch migration protein RuvA [Methylomonas sp. MED-D]|uniref:Holliday junction branch migration complex subunit RuvA n=1 Tax=Methylomonas koyamae TaxID=702114 RepID=A0A177NBP5_9GAMM|nr:MULTISPECIES: Holliday junction branch migration protein RuvA [Methylomonas]NJA07754.1 Holliday junction branch migration protein RuvA [Methylococcaceae bacterium WWC4]MDT4332474.1 Holliday junction branch migration protein RuvA [Methylomonas sp. MV1]OAI15292.1 Holliday junction ATP-dependent DNA helicase RuvA [Methylomonas koyamae]OHX35397.1 Holliday junction DNA helicase RuvA [Methylomonas sp. LWB]WGS85364.1 Holliday junction branch migration protein RuvA [Methylomonas sp. UP202]